MSTHSNSSFTLGFAFVYFLGERSSLLRERSRVMAQRLTKIIFVINFNPTDTRIRYIERNFEPFGKILRVRIPRNFPFVQFETQEHATKALECTHMMLRRGRPSHDYGHAHSLVYDDRYSGAYYRGMSPNYGRYPSCSRSRSPVCR
ncbi:hypothetical protein MKX03_015989 [Papaver bracteatum]|nr:hypothetical protein MKX03_015989 [Papaver bracteatum]